MVGFMEFLIFLITAAALVVTTARLHHPWNLAVAGLLFVCLLTLSTKFFGFGLFTIIYGLWMVLMVGGLYALRNYLRRS